MGISSRHPPRRGLVVSDLHLFAYRSQGSARFTALRAELSVATVLVLNGDIFDFRWSTLRDQAASVIAALDYLRGLTVDFPQCEVHLILGNHDCLAAFQTGLTALSNHVPRLQWHEHSWRLGTAWFIHGDCAHRNLDVTGFQRFREAWRQDRQRGPLAAAAYLCADRLGMTRLAHIGHFPRRQTVQRLAYHLDKARPGWRAGTLDCYFGHTHRPFANYLFEGIRFHNTGSTIRGMDFNPICFEIPEVSDEAGAHEHVSLKLDCPGHAG